MSKIEVYAESDPPRVEININGVAFVAEVNTYHNALRLALRVVKALGLGRTPDQGTLIIDGEAVPTIPEPKEPTDANA